MWVLIGIAFISGILSFLSPCSIGMIPAYIGFYIINSEDASWKNIYLGLFRGIALALGFSTIFIIFAIIIIIFGNIIIGIVPIITITIGVIIILLGISTFINKGFSFNVLDKLQTNLGKKVKVGKNIFSIYLFGLLYGLASLGCSFPLFISVILSTFIEKNYYESSLVGISYILGIFLVAIILSLLLVISSTFIEDKLFKYRLFINKIAGIVMLLAGIYIIYYQLSPYFSLKIL